MAQAVLLRAANVGGRQVFSPKAFCDEHPTLQLTNFGAAGTFVSQRDDAALVQEIRQALPIDADMAVVPMERVIELVESNPFAGAPADAKAEVTVLLAPRTGDMAWPRGEGSILLHDDRKWCILTCRMPAARGRTPQAIVEKATGVPATTRSWAMLQRMAAHRG